MEQRRSNWAAFLRLWFVLQFSYLLLRLLIDLAVAGYLDLRSIALIELLAVPFGQAVVLWLVTRRSRT